MIRWRLGWCYINLCFTFLYIRLCISLVSQLSNNNNNNNNNSISCLYNFGWLGLRVEDLSFRDQVIFRSAFMLYVRLSASCFWFNP